MVPFDVLTWNNSYERLIKDYPKRPTWAGSFNTQLYGNLLMDLTKQTELNLSRLNDKLSEQEQWEHCGPSSPLMMDKCRSSNSSVSIMFTNPDDFMPSDSSKENISSALSTSSVRSVNNCYLCSTLDEQQKDRLRLRVKKPQSGHGSNKRKQWLRSSPPKPKLRKELSPLMESNDALYKVIVWTGNIPDAGTNANVFITLLGDEGVLPKKRLCHRQRVKQFTFVRGSKDIFYIRGPKLGVLSMITLEHDGLERRHAWYVERVDVKCIGTNRMWTFLCKRWFSMHHGNFCIKHDLEAAKRENVIKVLEITIETGMKRLSGTDALVYITLHGTDGDSSKFCLNADRHGECFQRGQIDKFTIRSPVIGVIRSIRIEHDGTGIAPGWLLNKVTIQDKLCPKAIFYFPYNGWLAKDVGDGSLFREISAKRHLPKEIVTGQPVLYDVMVKTGDVRYAGTNANVYIIFIGQHGKSPNLFIKDSNNNFERGKTESFQLWALNVGNLKSIIIGHDNSGPGAGWFCDYITVRKHLSRSEIIYEIRKQKTIWKHARKQRQQRSSYRYFEDGADNCSVDDKINAGNNDHQRHNDDNNCFPIAFDQDGKIVKIPAYHEYHFSCKCWLASDEGDGLLERELQSDSETLFYQNR